MLYAPVHASSRQAGLSLNYKSGLDWEEDNRDRHTRLEKQLWNKKVEDTLCDDQPFAHIACYHMPILPPAWRQESDTGIRFHTRPQCPYTLQ